LRPKWANMPYADFTLERVELDFGLTTRLAELFPNLAPLPVPEPLAYWLARGRQTAAIVSEKARSEFIVAPILLITQDQTSNALSIYSGQRLDVDPARGLVGECDFILALVPPVPRLKAPLLTVLEAKRGDIELGLGQCAAQMVAARLFNERAGEGNRSIFGCVTTGEVWQFLRLEGDLILLDPQRLYLDNLGGILAVLRAIIIQGELG